MSAEDSELTFIRCPSCRSLVPAVATRCRMCGHQFGAQETATEAPKSKVKQEIEESSANRNVLYSESQEDSEFEDMTEDFSEDEEEGEDEDFSPSAATSQNGSESAGRKKRRRRRKKRNQDQSFSQEKPAEASRFETRSEPARQEAPRFESKPEPVRQEAPRFESKPEPVRQEAPRFELKPEPVRQEAPRYEARPEPVRQEAPKKNVEVASGVLVGWLVNYAQNANGASIELRSGKYFVARQRLRDDDLVIPDSAISTPHCLIKASKGSLQIQDLMSEQGTFVKKQGSASFVSVEEVGVIEHGDRIRFGAYEVVVCLVP